MHASRDPTEGNPAIEPTYYLMLTSTMVYYSFIVHS